jgi:MFS transporter, PAT family, beta-lactamase induction signal transducer AmpG
MSAPTSAARAWSWIPTLYFGQGLPYVAVMTLSVVMYKNLGLSNADIALYTSWLYLPWVIKPLWSPLVDLVRTKRVWILAMQLLVGAAFACVALTLPAAQYVRYTLAFFWLLAFASATHDIAADGFYMLALKQHEQAAFVGIRSTFYRCAMIFGQGALVWLAGTLTTHFGDAKTGWQIVFFVMGGLFVVLSLAHTFSLPKPDADVTRVRGSAFVSEFIETFVNFFQKKDILLALGFLLTYRLGEAQALKLIAPFMLDAKAKGGLGFTTEQFGFVYGTVGVLALTCGGILGGLAISRKGLRAWLWPMIFAVHLPNLLFVALALTQPASPAIVTAAIAIEQFGYGFGFAAYMLFMIMIADGEHKTAHYALCTGFMALGMMLPGMVSGKIQEALGYPQFFMWVCVCTLPSMVIAYFLKISPEFGRKVEAS